MFKVDMEAIREAAVEAWLMANPANPANPSPMSQGDEASLATLATLAVSQTEQGLIDPAVRALLSAAMRACDHFQDSQASRVQMVRECLEVPPEHREELASYFAARYPGI